ncbi:MAG: flagellar biosynthesis regulator FlaF [Desulfobacteraceae bacterium]|nr:flagellar biosynthesis regulator FlaF [Desulfobacteraceae bacterium]
MNSNALRAYDQVSRTTLSGPEIEAAVLTKAAIKLKNCQDNWHADERDSRLDEALKFNQRMWSIFQGELGREDNPLQKEVRRDVLKLSAFVDKRILEIMAYPEPEKLTAIISINQNIAAGLSQRPMAGDDLNLQL